ncbi:threonyl-tRNA synthetase (RNA binding domain TGS+ +tRNA synthetase) [Cryptosporidium bovis]|uniref:threonyl-tRNA synthetase (RNA binding domain TGS+ +tRNA synthetase) n=1 Tax=Cryptosporidium bovis TaxID=310047 RepID=UPI00351A656A|nr:threonyl-tRNA synthetase (RNA binding domain TGS+ +tRNA synthetase) [Cryptosporidium bovis]
MEAKRIQQGTERSLSIVGKIGGEFKVQKKPEFVERRLSIFKALYERQNALLKEKASKNEAIKITLQGGDKKDGVKFQTTPMDIAKQISKKLSESCIVAKVKYSSLDVVEDEIKGIEDDEVEQADQDVKESECCGSEFNNKNWRLWDANRPLEGNCELLILTFDSKEGRGVFWHSSSHVLGQCLENEYGAQVTIGPALDPGFYYDSYMGTHSVSNTEYSMLENCAKSIASDKQVFERLECSKEEALDLFRDNPFKLALITSKIPENAKTTVYRCGSFVDLCTGPHIPHTGLIKAFKIMKNSGCNWLGNTENDALQRVYGVSFPDKKELDEYVHMLEEAKKRDHRLLGSNLNLFFFDPSVSPGSCFWLPAGAKMYNKLIEFIRNEYRIRDFTEVITPNIFSCDLWKTSGHYFAYKEDMFLFEVEKKEWGLKPMNCPGHCIMFKYMNPSYKQLPIKLADFGVLHRNEFSGALNGLTRVRRFQQDDAHIFCAPEQIQEEVFKALDFLFFIYGQLGFKFDLFLSTMPKEHLGTEEQWKEAEDSLKEALDKTGRNWKINPGDGAFYGPKIDIMLWDALNRQHQCGTIQLDFQLPIRFNLQYRTDESTASNNCDSDNSDTDKQQPVAVTNDSPDAVKQGFKRPVIIHRAILGSVERMSAVILEHTAGKLPFWLSPRQAIVLSISEKTIEYAKSIERELNRRGFDVSGNYSGATINKKIRESQLLQWNYMLVIGENEVKDKKITVRCRDTTVPQEVLTLEELISKFSSMGFPSSQANP